MVSIKGGSISYRGGLDMKVTVDEETCIGCEACVDICPEVFEMVNDKAVAKTVEVPVSLIKACKEAAENCPVEAIRLED